MAVDPISVALAFAPMAVDKSPVARASSPKQVAFEPLVVQLKALGTLMLTFGAAMVWVVNRPSPSMVT